MHPAQRSLFALGYTLGMSAKAIVAARRTGSSDVVAGLAMRWAERVCQGCGVEVHASGVESLDLGTPMILAANHQSLADVPCIVVGFGRVFGFLAKKELHHVPWFGHAMVLAGSLFVDRSSPERSHQSIAEAAARVRAGASLVVFPEGTRAPRGRVLPFKKGPFHLVQAAGVPLVPVGIVGTADVLARDGWLARPAKVELRVGAPLSCGDDSAEAREDLRQRTRAAIAALTGFEEM